MTDPGFIPFTISVGMSNGAGRPGINAVVMTKFDLAMCALINACWRCL